MKLIKVAPFTLAATITAGLVYSAWTYSLLLWKRTMIANTADIMHSKILRLMGGYIKVSWESYMSGVTQVMFAVFICALTFALLYTSFNRALRIR